MSPFFSLHRLAAARGDGLNPLLLNVLDAQSLAGKRGDNVVDLAQWRGDPHIQAGPHPPRRPDIPLAADITVLDCAAQNSLQTWDASPKTA